MSAVVVVNPPSFAPTEAPTLLANVNSASDTSSVTSSKRFIAGIVVGCIAFIACCGIFSFGMKRWRQKSIEQEQSEKFHRDHGTSVLFEHVDVVVETRPPDDHHSYSGGYEGDIEGNHE